MILLRYTKQKYSILTERMIIMTPGERIKKLRKEQGLTQEELGKALGVQKAAVQKYEKGTVQNIKRENIIKLAKVLQTTPEYILGWDMPDNVYPYDEELVSIPVLAKVSAGLGCYADSLNNAAIDYETVQRTSLISGENYVYLMVEGDSMYPIFIEGDLVLVRCQSSVDSGSYAVVTIDGEDGVIKKIVYGKDFIELHSINPMYPVRHFEGEDVLKVRVFGLVKEIKRKF